MHDNEHHGPHAKTDKRLHEHLAPLWATQAKILKCVQKNKCRGIGAIASGILRLKRRGEEYHKREYRALLGDVPFRHTHAALYAINIALGNAKSRRHRRQLHRLARIASTLNNGMDRKSNAWVRHHMRRFAPSFLQIVGRNSKLGKGISPLPHTTPKMSFFRNMESNMGRPGSSSASRGISRQSAFESPFVLGAAKVAKWHGRKTWMFKLSNGLEMPAIFFSLSHWTRREQIRETLGRALDLGHRAFDGAQDYFPAEDMLGEVLAKRKIPRKELYLVSKLGYLDDYGNGLTRKTVLSTLKRLKTKYLDLYYLYDVGRTLAEEKAAWREMEQLHKEGKIRALGISNFPSEKIKRIMGYAKIKPHVLQNHFNIYMPGHFKLMQKNVFPLVRKHKMVFLSRRLLTYSDLTALQPIDDPHVKALAASYKRTPAQILYRWALQQGVGIVAKAENPAHMRSNTKIFDFALKTADLAYLNQIGKLNHPANNPWFDKTEYEKEAR